MVKKQNRLFLRNHNYYVRIAVPRDLFFIVKRNEVRYSLNTKNYYDACQKVRIISAMVDVLFNKVRNCLMKINKVSDEATDVLLSREDYEKFFIYELDRIARNTLDLLTIIKEIKDKDCSITFIKEGWTFSNQENFANKTQELMLTIMGAIAQAERITIKERQMEGIKIAQERGKYQKAHPTKLNKLQLQQLKDDRTTGMTETELMNKYHISKPTLYRYLKK